jgi:uncharacterized membrane protein YraQ (UPF0718 family)
VAGIIAAFVPRRFFETLFVGSGSDTLSVSDVVLQALIAPIAAFFTFIGSMGNIPLAAVLYENGVSFAGVMAFIFSDLVVLPVLRIQAQYYGWRMALYVLAVFLVVLVGASLLLHAGFALFDQLPSGEAVRSVTDRSFFALDYTAVLNGIFLVMSVFFVVWKWHDAGIGGVGGPLREQILLGMAVLAALWLAGGLLIGVSS